MAQTKLKNKQINNDGWIPALGTWTPRSQAFTNDPAAGANIELEMTDTSGFEVGDVIKVTSGAGSENALITVVHANVHLTVAALVLNHDTTTPSVKFADTLYVERAYTGDPAAGNNIELAMADTTGFSVGDLVEVSSSAGRENATVTVVHANTHLTVNTLALDHTTTSPMVKQVVQNTFIVDTSGDLSSVLGVGQRIKFTDSTVKYFILVAISTTRLTLYGGTDYSVVSTAAVTSPSYSMVKAPYGFPLNQEKWTWHIDYLVQWGQATPGQYTWYNIGGIFISVPIGSWVLGYSAAIYLIDATSAIWHLSATLSTANNTESDNELTTWCYGGNLVRSEQSINISKALSVSSRTNYYYNLMTSSTGLDNMYTSSFQKTIIRAVCAYL